MATFHLEFPVDGLRGADYNPRRIDENSLAALRESLATLGVAKPIIVSGDLIVAGHQRTKSLRALGWTHVPAITLKAVTKTDEVRFNQLHNGTDFDSGDENALLPPFAGEPFTFEEVPALKLSANQKAKKLPIRYEICDLLLLYGNWGCCVATMDGEVIHAAQYAMACQMINTPIRVYRVPNELKTAAAQLLGRQYGVFSYDHLERNTYMQTFAQLKRIRGEAGRGSQLYKFIIEPEIKKGERLLDFGCGQADHLKRLQQHGHQAFGVEFYFRAGTAIDTRAVHRMIEQVAADVEAHGLYDVVLADSVLNSVDSLQAESDVLTCLNAFCKPGGRIHFSGRSRDDVEWRGENLKTAYTRQKHRHIEFLDEHGFSGTFREGKWFYQKFHTAQQIASLAQRFIGAKYETTDYTGGNSWCAYGRKHAELSDEEIRAAIGREFDLMWPDGRSVGKSTRMLAAWERGRNISRQSASSDTL